MNFYDGNEPGNIQKSCDLFTLFQHELINLRTKFF